MLTDTQIADKLVQLYAATEDEHEFDFLECGTGDNGICWALEQVQPNPLTPDDPGEYLFMLRGSKTVEDWLRDLIALATPFHHQAFGPVHPGFLIGMSEAVDEMLGYWDRKTPITVAGHSLGAGRAAIACAFMLIAGVPSSHLRRVVFGEPKPGLPQLAEFLAPIVARSYRNGMGAHHDLVTDVPLTLPPFESYVHPTPLTLVEQPPEGMVAQFLDVFGFHHMPLYAAALARLGV